MWADTVKGAGTLTAEAQACGRESEEPRKSCSGEPFTPGLESPSSHLAAV